MRTAHLATVPFKARVSRGCRSLVKSYNPAGGKEVIDACSLHYGWGNRAKEKGGVLFKAVLSQAGNRSGMGSRPASVSTWVSTEGLVQGLPGAPPTRGIWRL